MALWKETSSNPGAVSGATPPLPSAAPKSVTELHKGPERGPEPPPVEARRAAPVRPAPVESVIAAEITIEGKIAGSGDVRIAGRFKGDVNVDGNFRIDSGAHLEGQVHAGVVVVGGELQGNIEAARQVDVLSTGVIVGDVKAPSLTVAAGSRMRGHVEFGWDNERSRAVELKGAPRSA